MFFLAPIFVHLIVSHHLQLLKLILLQVVMGKNGNFGFIRTHLGSQYKEQISFVGCLNLHHLIRAEMECHCLLNRGPALLLLRGHAPFQCSPSWSYNYDPLGTIFSVRTQCLEDLCFGKALTLIGFGWTIVFFSDSFPIKFSQTGWSENHYLLYRNFYFPLFIACLK